VYAGKLNNAHFIWKNKMFRKTICLIFLAVITTSHAQNLSNFGNAVQQIQSVVEQVQQSQLSQANTAPAQRESSGITCFVMDSDNTRWATGGQNITSCDPAVIQGQINQPYGYVAIWQFLSDSEILRTTIYGPKMNRAPFKAINTYERSGKRIVENNQGCKLSSDIISETASAITIKDVGASGNCDSAVKMANQQLVKMPPTIYKKIKS
jgi:hypothetical protein